MTQDPKKVLWANLVALQQTYWNEVNDNLLARRAKMVVSNVTRTKKQKTSTGLDVVQKYAGAFGVEVWQLLYPGLNPLKPPVCLEMSPRTADVARLMEALPSEAARERVHAILVQLVELRNEEAATPSPSPIGSPPPAP